MMFGHRVTTDTLIDQLGAESYDPVVLQRIARFVDGPRLSEYLLQPPRLGVTGTIAGSYVSQDVDKAVPYLTTLQVKGLFAYPVECKYITKDADKQWSKCRVRDGAILINKSGNVGAAALLRTLGRPHVNSVSDLINIYVRNGTDGIDAAFLVVFLNSPYGQTQLQRLSGGAVFDHVSIYAIPELRLFVPKPTVQKYIGDKVRQAERLRQHAHQVNNELLRDQYESLVPAVRPAENSSPVWRPRSQVIDSIRLDPKYYAPEYRSVAESAASNEFVSLGDVVDEVRYGASVDADYVAHGDGLPFVRGTNVLANRIDASELVSLNYRLRDIIGNNLLREGQILITRSGTVGIAAVVTSEIVGAAYGSFMMSMSPKPDIDPYYLTWFLNSWIGVNQIRRRQNGAIQLNINIQELLSVRVWQTSSDIQQSIASSVRQWHNALENAERLTNAAKLLVESLIEGNLTEDDLSAAQRALETGNRDLDRAILARLTRKGLDVAGEPPLFPDLDALYAAIDEASAAAEEGGDG